MSASAGTVNCGAYVRTVPFTVAEVNEAVVVVADADTERPSGAPAEEVVCPCTREVRSPTQSELKRERVIMPEFALS